MLKVLNKITLIKSFLTGILYDCIKLIYTYLNEGDKIIAQLGVCIFIIFFIKPASLKRFLFETDLYLKLLQ